MGHERLGLLPKTQKWSKIVTRIQSSSGEVGATPDIVAATAKAVETRFRDLGLDPAVRESFAFLVALSMASRADNPRSALKEMGFSLSGDATPLNIARLLHERVRAKNGSQEYAQLARSATLEAVGEFFEQRSKQGDLFSRGTAFDVWRGASNGAGFCELARQFFACLTKGHLEYFLEREASAVLPTLHAREQFKQNLERYVDDISRHSFETAKITQSFAAGWYNKHAQDSLPTAQQIRSFLRVACNKIRDSLSREAAA